MAYVPVPKDLSKVKTKVAFNLTKRQILCFSVALLMGLPLFFLLKDSAGTSLAAMAMIVVMLPCFLVAMYEKHGQPLEVVSKEHHSDKIYPPQSATVSDGKPICTLGETAGIRKGGISDCQKDRQKRRGKPQETGVS